MSALRHGLAATLAVALALAGPGGCGDTGQRRVSFPLAAAGTAPSELRVGDWAVVVEEARVAFGPVYLCSTAVAGLDSCSESVAEHLGTTSFDALSPEPTAMGAMHALTSTVLSGMWDYGRSWRLPETSPRPSADAIEGAHSAVLVVRASDELGAIRRYRLVLDVDGAGQPSGSTAVRARLGEHTLTASERGLVVRFDPTLWASMIDFDALATLPEAEPPGAPIEVPPGHVAQNAVTTAMTTSGLPLFEWQSPD